MKQRLDRLLVARGLVPSRQRAQALVAAGLVRGEHGRVLDKAGTMLPPTTTLEVKENPCPFVSRGGLKLDAALDYFAVDPASLVALDIGASTGGFTDCLLQRGATRVYAVDVGYGQLAWKLRQDPRVVVMERTNARHLTPASFPEAMDLAVLDASFISLELLLPPLLPLLKPAALIIPLIKPQFEVGKGKVGKGGVVRDEELHREVVTRLRDFAEKLGLDWQGVITSPVPGPKGNLEFLAKLQNSSQTP
ncbi:TlyA family RNA methyltransferase [Desulfurivibrio dismutans]|uniref:TlyA family RNA methyltransferase n=1 Tax=Desulfurivibrio dismutans TaxID=1398908 RepID=UPI0023DA8DBA|nr:TlyA family RNA methyltransferase [Desulfurivibrio alkaliphilus]MDF1614618.1 TlyA family RNA methyltransferase [Desulfurivibrio alkaliphilus]